MKTFSHIPSIAAAIAVALTLGGCSSSQHSANVNSHQETPQYHIGGINKAQLLSQYPLFANNKAADEADYTTEQALKLAKHIHGRKIVVVFGTWCHDSQREVPKLLNLLETAQTTEPELEFELQLIAVAPSAKRDQALVKRYQIAAVPTIMLVAQDKELGRIVEHTKQSLVLDLLNMQ